MMNGDGYPSPFLILGVSNVGITRECGAFQLTLLYALVALVGFMQCWAAL